MPARRRCQTLRLAEDVLEIVVKGISPRLIYAPLRGVRSPLSAVCNYMLALWSRLTKHLLRVRREANRSLKRM